MILKVFVTDALNSLKKQTIVSVVIRTAADATQPQSLVLRLRIGIIKLVIVRIVTLRIVILLKIVVIRLVNSSQSHEL